MARGKAVQAGVPTPCRWVDCIYWGVVDEAGSCCDEKQVRVCEDIRAAAAAQNVPDINVGDKETRTLRTEWTEELTLARPLTEEERAAILPEEEP